jgi:orotate phosphoribosyltransferase
MRAACPKAPGKQNGVMTLASRVFANSHLTGTFVLRSGRTADRYFDKYRFESDPSLSTAIVEELAPLVPSETDGLAGLELGRVPIATMLSAKTGSSRCQISNRPESRPLEVRRRPAAGK